MTVALCPAGPEDATALAAMSRRRLEDEGRRSPMDAAQLAERMRTWLGGGGYVAQWILADGQRAGYALYRVSADACDPSRPEVHLRQFFIDRPWRCQRIGWQALDLLRGLWPERAAAVVEVAAENAAGAAFWRGAGFADHTLTLRLEATDAR